MEEVRDIGRAGGRMVGRRGALVVTSAALIIGMLGLTGCGNGASGPTPGQAPTGAATGASGPASQPGASGSVTSETATAGPSAGQGAPTEPAAATAQLQPVGTPRVIAENLDAPWSMVRLKSGSTLISERDTATVLELESDGSMREVGTIAGVHPEGEGGLLGLAVLPGATIWLYAYFTSSSDNRVVRMPLEGAAGTYTLGAATVLVDGIPKAANHDGGRLQFGPDGMLYVTTGDANGHDNAQNLKSLGGKILRLTPDGGVPADNPFPGSFVYSWGHRNPQGLAWTSDGTMWASEFGQNTWDELNIITAGSNYGWPDVEGKGGGSKFVDPVLVWRTSDASPSGLTVVGGTLFMAGLGGQRLWVIYPDAAATNGGTGARAVEFYDGKYGRIRDVLPGPAGSLWFMTNNTDGRGTPSAGDDKIYQVQLGRAG